MLGPGFDLDDEVVDGGEDTPAKSALGEDGEPALDEVQPRRAGGVKYRCQRARLGSASHLATGGAL